MSPNQVSGTLHQYRALPAPLSAFAHDIDTSSGAAAVDIVIIVTGLNGSLPAVGYCNELANALSSIGWQLVQVMLSSVAGSWGGGSVKQDATELAQCIRYFKEECGAERVVIMGHSTGTQDCIVYHHLGLDSLLPEVSGTILQAPVSDRECLSVLKPDLDVASTLNPPPGSTLDSFVPPELSKLWGTQAGITYRRWRSIAATPDSDEINFEENEDFFSSDMSAERWSNVLKPVKTPLLVLLGEDDEAYPPEVRADNVLSLFRQALGPGRWHKESRVIPAANHSVDDATARQTMFRAIKTFLNDL